MLIDTGLCLWLVVFGQVKIATNRSSDQYLKRRGVFAPLSEMLWEHWPGSFSALLIASSRLPKFADILPMLQRAAAMVSEKEKEMPAVIADRL
jgi:hypothetical protein